MPIELKAPSGLWLLGLLVPLVLLYVLKIRRQRVTVSSTWLWAAAARDLAAKSPFKRLVPQLPLLLELLALSLLALALSRPASRAGHIAGEHVAIVVDTSASMAALEPDGRSRLAHARDAAS
ncbi:MAG TPA: BatA domain-containing protein, partial [Polyangiaceae bacterium]